MAIGAPGAELWLLVRQRDVLAGVIRSGGAPKTKIRTENSSTEKHSLIGKSTPAKCWGGGGGEETTLIKTSSRPPPDLCTSTWSFCSPSDFRLMSRARRHKGSASSSLPSLCRTCTSLSRLSARCSDSFPWCFWARTQWREYMSSAWSSLPFFFWMVGQSDKKRPSTETKWMGGLIGAFVPACARLFYVHTHGQGRIKNDHA